MAIVTSTGYKNVQNDMNFNSASGHNFDAGTLEIRSGAAPGPDAAQAGTLIAAIVLPADAVGASAAGVVSKAGTWSVAAAAAGTAAHWRLKETGDAGGASTTLRRLEGTVTATGGGGDMTVDNTNIAAAQVVTVNTATFTAG